MIYVFFIVFWSQYILSSDKNRTVLSKGPFCQTGPFCRQGPFCQTGPFCQNGLFCKKDRSVQTDRSVNRTILSLTERSGWQNGPVYRTVRLTERSVSPFKMAVIFASSNVSFFIKYTCLLNFLLFRNPCFLKFFIKKVISLFWFRITNFFSNLARWK
jgi:hypothetical protein